MKNQLTILANFQKKSVFILIAIISYLIIGSGLHGDDHTAILGMKGISFYEFLTTPFDISIFGIVGYYLYWWPYYLLGDDYQIIYDLIKVAANILSVLFVYKFAQGYLTKNRALLASILFVFYPSHEVTTYWFMTFSYVLVPSLIMLGHYEIDQNNRYKGLFLTTLGAFASYGSIPYIFGLSTIFFIKKQTNKALLFLAPGILYVGFYFFIKFKYDGLERRINEDLGFIDYIKQLIAQPLSLADAIIGPSYWLKSIFAIYSISWVSLIIVAIITAYFILFRVLRFKRPRFNKNLVIGLSSVLLLSFFMYALTGLYQHSPFNLGNRSTTYGSLLLAFLIAMFIKSSKLNYIFLLLFFLLPNFGLSDHWKSWNNNQLKIISNVRSNQQLKSIEKDSILLVTDNLYSKLGPFSHIEFFSMPWHTKSIFKEHVKTNNIITLTPYLRVQDNFLIDEKSKSRKVIRNNIYLYSSKDNTLRKISSDQLLDITNQKQGHIRHWIQLFKNTFIAEIVVWISPRLSFLFI